jgi:large subunit ribosomal protein L10
MPLTRGDKQQLIDEYGEGLAKAPHAFLLSFRGITVPQVTELRSKVRETGGSYVVVKNRLAKLAIKDQPLGALEEEFTGPTAVVFSNDDPVAVAKALTDFAKTVPAIEFKGGLLNGQQVAADQIKEIANLPSREELIAKLLFLLQSPITRFVRGLAAIQRDFVVVLDQIAQKKEG